MASEPSATLKAPKKSRAWRITQIPSTIAENLLLSQLETLLLNAGDGNERRPTISRLKLVPSSSNTACATVTIENPPETPDGTKEGYYIDDNFLEVTPLHDDGDESVDIVAVPGLGSHALGSFSSKTSDVWLRDFLPETIPGIRVLLYGYSTGLVDSDSKASIGDYAKAFLEEIIAYRINTKTTRRPIIFIGHSLGGLVIKEALAFAHDSRQDSRYNELFLSSYGFVFFGVPNLGLRSSQLEAMTAGQPNKDFVQSLVVREMTSEPSDYLKALGSKFQKCCEAQKPPFEIISYFESRRSSTMKMNGEGIWEKTGPKDFLVTEASACQIGPTNAAHHCFVLDTDHYELVKFSRRLGGGYNRVKMTLKTLVERASDQVLERFEEVEQIDDLGGGIVQEQQEAIQSLAFKNMDSRPYDVMTASHHSVAWLIKHRSYVKWMEQRQSLLWIRGKPGSGKSTLMKFACKLGEQVRKEGESVLLAFFFSARGEPLQKTAIGLFRALLHQLLRQMPSLRPRFKRAHQKKTTAHGLHGTNWEWHSDPLWELLKTYVHDTSEKKQVRIIVDALDECSEDACVNMSSCLRELMLPSSTKQRLNILISCRHYPIPIINPTTDLQIILENETYESITFHVKDSLEPWHTQHNSGAVSEIETEIVRRASGSFLWVSSMLKAISSMNTNGESMRTIRRKLQDHSQELDDVYEHNFQRLSETNQSKSLMMMRWICFAMRPLDLWELQSAMAYDKDPPFPSLRHWNAPDDYIENDDYIEDEDYIENSDQMIRLVISLSGGLVEVFEPPEEDRDRSIIWGQKAMLNIQGGICTEWSWERHSKLRLRFTHESVNHYIKSKDFSSLHRTSHNNEAVQPHHQLARACFNFLQNEKIQKFGHGKPNPLRPPDHRIKAPKSCHFLHYATYGWIVHLARAEEEGSSPEDILAWFDFPSDQIFLGLSKLAKRMMPDTFGSLCLNGNLLHFACFYNLKLLVRRMLEQGDIDVNATSADGKTALAYAISGCREEIVQLLVSHNDIHVKPCALTSTAEYGNVTIARALLSEGADVNAFYDKGMSPLQAATIREKNVEEMMRFLIDKGADVNYQGRYPTALQLVAKRGHERAARMLIEHGAKADTRGGEYGSALNAAAVHGSTAVAQILLTNGADANSRGGVYGSALHDAAARGHNVVAEHLLKHGANVNVREKVYASALHAAAHGRASMVRLLLMYGSNILTWEARYGTPLQAALAGAVHDARCHENCASAGLQCEGCMHLEDAERGAGIYRRYCDRDRSFDDDDDRGVPVAEPDFDRVVRLLWEAQQLSAWSLYSPHLPRRYSCLLPHLELGERDDFLGSVQSGYPD